MSRHEIVNAAELPEPVGFSHAVVAAPGRTVYLGGQTGNGESIVDQLDSAAGKLVVALEAAGGTPDDVVSLVVYTTDVDEYRAASRELGDAWRRHFGKRYPAMALIGVSALYEPHAKVELVAIAVVDR